MCCCSSHLQEEIFLVLNNVHNSCWEPNQVTMTGTAAQGHQMLVLAANGQQGQAGQTKDIFILKHCPPIVTHSNVFAKIKHPCKHNSNHKSHNSSLTLHCAWFWVPVPKHQKQHEDHISDQKVLILPPHSCVQFCFAPLDACCGFWWRLKEEDPFWVFFLLLVSTFARLFFLLLVSTFARQVWHC